MLNIKLKHEEVTRRVQFWRTCSAYQTLVKIAKEKFEISSEYLSFTYRDEEGDIITISSDEEFALCASDVTLDGKPKQNFSFQVTTKDPHALKTPEIPRTGAPKVIHESTECRECSAKPIIGARFLCSVRPNYNICEKCESRGQPHPMLKIYESTAQQFSIRRIPPACPNRPDRRVVPLVLQSPLTQGQPVSFGDLVHAVARELIKKKNERRAPPDAADASRVPWAKTSRAEAEASEPFAATEAHTSAVASEINNIEAGDQHQQQIPPSSEAAAQAEVPEAEISATSMPPIKEAETSLISSSNESSMQSSASAGGEIEPASDAKESVFSISTEMDNLLSAVSISEAKAETAEPIDIVVEINTPVAVSSAAPMSRPLISSRLVSDITIPDFSILQPRTAFTKVWLVKNEGPNDWPVGVKLVPSGGDLLCDTNTSVSIHSAAVGEMIQISIELTSPSKAGRYVAYFSLQGPDGSLFGQQFWVDIRITQSIVDLPSAKPKQDPVETLSAGELFFDAGGEQKQSAVVPPEPVSQLEKDRAEWYAELEELKSMGFSDEATSLKLLKEHTKWSLSSFPQLRGGPFRDTMPLIIDALLQTQRRR